MNQDIRAPYYGELGRLSFSPGWARPEPAMWPAPKPQFKPAVWRYAAAREALEQAGEFVPVEQAERRNLIMVNPIQGNIYATSRNIVAAYQMVKAGEKARSHRHTAAALRLVVEAKPGTYTVVDGARVDMAPGVVVMARPCQRERRDQLLDRLSRRAVRAAFGSDVLRGQPRRLRDHHRQ